ncbi:MULTISPECIES: permease-like cell division protein FtsX [Auritidibacter]|uniref:Cell division protein FtsX n=1 Tax=Auritidibacter ignavus TaxID=678932 RepID=A0AAJ6AH61_9MICC|nr:MULTISPECIES: permease-like cell division protein FtsX [Auritidibacter]AXR73196.1 ABC transporter permease [Auritidibacter sp. NML130574]NIH71655.1 cell division transport system permease protein [Auritidibacter ignavus]PXA77474.1 cell division protein FtsX [Auritidibacter sp. NML100628]PXA81951.1 cell division protein FtsX [Auritidibacter sp. NML120636]RMX24202.1 ABC transporter permease [Auritidibacter ignavus]
MRVRFIFGETFSGIRRNLSMVISVILVTFVSLTFVGAAGLLQQQINQMKGYWYDRVEVAIFLCTENSLSAACSAGAVTDEQRQAIEDQLESPQAAEYVDSYEYESQEMALEIFQEQFANSEMAEVVTADQLPESFRVKLVDPEQYEVINEMFANMPGVEEVSDQRELLESLFAIMNIASVVAVGLAVVMLVTATLLIATTIRLSAFSRRRETGIMRLVGASKSMIQLPFLAEGVLAAVLGAVLASVTTWALAEFFVGNWLATQYPDTGFISGQDALVLIPLLIVIAVVLAAVSSWLTLRRYLKV